MAKIVDGESGEVETRWKSRMAQERADLLRLIDPGVKRVKAMLERTGLATEENLVKVDMAAGELANKDDWGTNNMWCWLPKWPREPVMYIGPHRKRVDNSREAVRAAVSLDKKLFSTESGNSVKATEMTGWEFALDVQEGVRVLGLNRRLNELGRLAKMFRDNGGRFDPNSYNVITAPLYIWMRVQGFNRKDLIS